MPKPADKDLEKVTLNIYTGDKETLATFYSPLGWSVAARELISEHCKSLRKAAEDAGLEGPRPDVELEIPDGQPNSPVRSGPEVT